MDVDVSDLCCVNTNCADAGKRGQGNLRFESWIGRAKDIRFVRCATCRWRFSERKGTPLFRAKLPAQEVEAIARHLMEGNGDDLVLLRQMALAECLQRFPRAGDPSPQ